MYFHIVLHIIGGINMSIKILQKFIVFAKEFGIETTAENLKRFNKLI